jgi:hypothetical protein
LSVHITIDHDVFDVRSSEEGVALAQLFSTMVRDAHPHGVITDPIYVPGGEHGLLERWLVGRSAYEAEAFRSVLTKGLLQARVARNQVTWDRNHDPPRFHLPGPLQVRIERRTESDWTARKFTVADAADLLLEPVHLLVENRRTDLSFVVHLADPTNRKTLTECLKPPSRIQKVGGGSGELQAWLEELLTGDQTPDKWRRVLRGWVLFDRDAGTQDTREPSKNALDIMALCKRVVDSYGGGLSFICLGRREIESYVPDGGLATAATDRQKLFVDRVIAWRAREDRKEWAWAVDLKKGFHGDLRPAWSAGLSDADRDAIKKDEQPLQPQMLKAPFDGCSSAEIDEMKRGLGDKLGARLRAEGDPPDWALDFATEYDRGPADQVRRSMFVQSLLDRM